MADYGEIDISYKIGSIKKKLVRQYIKNKNITVGRALENILQQQDIKKNKALAETAVQKLRLLENADLKVNGYFSEDYLNKHGANV